MATATQTTVRTRPLEVAQTRDRDLLRTFLERDRLRAAYALCDLEDREFAKTKYAGLVEAIDRDKKFSKEIEAQMHDCLKDFKKSGAY